MQYITYNEKTGAITGIYSIHAQPHEIEHVMSKITKPYIRPDKHVMTADARNMKVDCSTKKLCVKPTDSLSVSQQKT